MLDSLAYPTARGNTDLPCLTFYAVKGDAPHQVPGLAVLIPDDQGRDLVHFAADADGVWHEYGPVGPSPIILLGRLDLLEDAVLDVAAWRVAA